MKHFFVVGFDFGTSYSKVVVRDQLTKVARAVTFGRNRQGLLPSYVTVIEDSLCGPLEKADGGFIVTYPKLIAADAVSERPRFWRVYRNEQFQAFEQRWEFERVELAGVILTRYFLTVLKEVGEFIPSQEAWSQYDPDFDPIITQVAVPTGLLDPKSDRGIDALFRRSLRAALFLSRGAGVPSRTPIKTLRDAYRKVDDLAEEERRFLEDRCLSYPEVAAGVQTIFRSQSMPMGKYITMDVGAGTVDLNVFYRQKEETDRERDCELHYWSCLVAPLGAAHLRRYGAPPHEQTFDDLTPETLSEQLRKTIHGLMNKALRRQPAKVVGDGGSPWRRNSLVYAWGGGMAHPQYGKTLVETLREYEIPVETPAGLPSPSDDFGIPGDVGDFGRLAIAYGLSFHYANLEAVKLPHQIKTFEELYPDYWKRVEPDRKWCSCHANPNCPKCYGTGFIQASPSRAPAKRASKKKRKGEAKSKEAVPRQQGQEPQPIPPTRVELTPRQAFIRFRDNFEGRRRTQEPPLLYRLDLLRSFLRFASKEIADGDSALHNEISRFQQKHLRFDGTLQVICGSASKQRVDEISVDCPLGTGFQQVFLLTDRVTNVLGQINRSSGRRTIAVRCQCRLEESGGYRLYLLSVGNGSGKRRGKKRRRLPG